jgi:hypothetical protein
VDPPWSPGTVARGGQQCPSQMNGHRLGSRKWPREQNPAYGRLLPSLARDGARASNLNVKRPPRPRGRTPARARLALTICLGVAFATAAMAQTVSVRDYKTPVSRARSLFGDLRYTYERADTTTLANDGRVGLSYDLFYESLPFAYSLTALGEWSRAWVEDEFDTAYSVDATARAKAYASRTHDLFAAFTADESVTRGDDRPATNVTLAVGWGRFIDATALRKAVRIDTYFVDEGVTTARMPRESLLAIAHIIESKRAYRQDHGADTYRKYWFGAIEAAAAASGVLAGDGIGAAGAFRVEEVLFRENIGDRFYGFEFASGVRHDLTSPDSTADRIAPRVDVTARYARPIRWSTQIDARARLNAPLDSDVGRVFDLDASAGYLYELTNRVDFRLEYAIDVHRPAVGADALLSHAVLPSFLLYLEDQLRLVATVRLIKPVHEEWRQEVALTLNYKAL